MVTNTDFEFVKLDDCLARKTTIISFCVHALKSITSINIRHNVFKGLGTFPQISGLTGE